MTGPDTSSPASPRQELALQIMRFGLAGLANVGVDLGVYVGLLALGAIIPVAKAVAFVCGTLFAYWANRTWTFKSTNRSLSVFGFVIGLYTVSMVINVSLNSAIIAWLGTGTIDKAAAYIVSVLASASLNFIGMRFAFQSGMDKIRSR